VPHLAPSFIQCRNGTLNEAKKDAGITRFQHPESVRRVEMRTAPHERGRVIKDENGKITWTKEYIYTNNKGQKNYNIRS